MKPRTITVYTKNNCVQCDRTKKWLDKNGVAYTTVNMDESPADLEAVKELGFLTAPVVIVSTGDPETELMWGGFIPDNLRKYTITELKAA
jgi:glutaredoxin-like protein NrdH